MLGAWKGGNMGVGEANLAAKATEIGALPEYTDAFKAVFGDGASRPTRGPGGVRLRAHAVCGPTAWDSNSMAPEAQRGWELFRGKAGCATCHTGTTSRTGSTTASASACRRTARAAT